MKLSSMENMSDVCGSCLACASPDSPDQVQARKSGTRRRDCVTESLLHEVRIVVLIDRVAFLVLVRNVVGGRSRDVGVGVGPCTTT